MVIIMVDYHIGRDEDDSPQSTQPTHCVPKPQLFTGISIAFIVRCRTWT